MFMKKIFSYIYGPLLVAFLVAVDQVTKYFARTCLSDDKTFDIIKKVLRFNYVQNTGAAWGMMSGKQTLFIILTTVMLIGIIYVYIFLSHKALHALCNSGIIYSFILSITFIMSTY